jgi:hypothetical protein
MKWIVGVILLIVSIILIILSIFMFPWFTTKTTYDRINIEEFCSHYWDDNLGGVERDWDESIYSLRSYELRSSRPVNWSGSSTSGGTSSGDLLYNSKPTAGGWDGTYQEMVDNNIPVAGFLPGGSEQLAIYNFVYYVLLISIVLALISIVLIILAGMEKIGALLPKIVVGITIIFVILAPLYFALALPPAIEADSKEYNSVKNPLNQNNTYRRPPEAGGIMGEANEKDDDSGRITSTTEFAPATGWWMAIVAIFLTIITIAFVSGPG